VISMAQTLRMIPASFTAFSERNSIRNRIAKPLITRLTAAQDRLPF
jgi:hypothetical protein